MLTHRGFSAWIVSGGKTLPEYLVAVDQHEHKVSCWIPSEEGQSFTIYWRDHGGKVDTCAFINLDGFVVPGRFLFGSGVASRQGVRSGPTTERPFVFQKVEEKEGETSSQATSKELGMIIVRIKRVKRVGSHPANPMQKIPETVLGKRKAGDLGIGFGKEKQAYDQYLTTWSVEAYDEDSPRKDKPSTYVSFVFRYRSHDFLQTQGIMTEEVEPVAPKRMPVRRVASAPAMQMVPSAETPAMVTPSPSPPKKKHKSKRSSFLHMNSSQILGKGPIRARRPSDMRRTVSWRVLSTKPETFPGQGMILFDEPAKETLKEDDEGDGETDSPHNE